MINKKAVFNKTALALTAALVLGSTSLAQAYEKLDPATGLRTEFYYAPLSTLEAQGAPINARARAYLRQHPASGNGYYAYGENGGFNARAQAPGPQFDFGASNWRNSQQYVPEFDGTGAPRGPYPFE